MPPGSAVRAWPVRCSTVTLAVATGGAADDVVDMPRTGAAAATSPVRVIRSRRCRYITFPLVPLSRTDARAPLGVWDACGASYYTVGVRAGCLRLAALHFGRCCF